MDDRVGDILAQRAGIENGLAIAVFVSLVFHGILSALAAWSAWHHVVQQAPTVMMIQFAKPAPAVEMTPAAPAVTAAPAPPPAPRVIEKTKPQPKAVPMSPFGKSTKKGREEPPRPTPIPLPAAPAQEVPVGGAGVTALEGGEFPYTFYIEQMKRLIGAHWFRPQVSGDTSTLVYFVIERDGSVRDAKIEVASGNGVFDRSALAAVINASPLPPLPFAYSGTYLGVHLKFR